MTDKSVPAPGGDIPKVRIMEHGDRCCCAECRLARVLQQGADPVKPSAHERDCVCHLCQIERGYKEETPNSNFTWRTAPHGHWSDCQCVTCMQFGRHWVEKEDITALDLRECVRLLTEINEKLDLLTRKP